jgi:hypothetical protein
VSLPAFLFSTVTLSTVTLTTVTGSTVTLSTVTLSTVTLSTVTLSETGSFASERACEVEGPLPVAVHSFLPRGLFRAANKNIQNAGC